MTAVQQSHLKICVDQHQKLVNEIQILTGQLNEKREHALKLQGIVEYLSSQGVEIPSDDVSNSQEESVSEESNSNE